MRKIINAEGQEFVPVSTDDLVLDAVPTVNSFNSVTSDAVARAVAGASGEVPAVTENDNGKVLKAIYDEGGPAVEWAEGGSDYSAGTGIEISEQGAIGVKIDGSTITTNGEGQLVAAGGGSGDSSVVITGTPAAMIGIRRADAVRDSYGVPTVYGTPGGYRFPSSSTGIASIGGNFPKFLHGIQFYGMSGGLKVNITNGGENPEIELVLASQNDTSKYAVYNSALQDCLFLRSQGIIYAEYGVYGKYVKVTSMVDDPTAWTFYGGADVSTFGQASYLYLGYRGKTSTVENTPAGSANIPGVTNMDSVDYIAWAANVENNNDGLMALMPKIPPFTGSDAGKVLAVDMYGTGLEWKSLT